MTDNQSKSPPTQTTSSPDRRIVAVAIRGGENTTDSTPKVIASGRGKLAEQILEMAFAEGIKVREDADLAELLAKLDLDTPIPSEAIITVAEILTRVYEANARLDNSFEYKKSDHKEIP